MPQNINCFEAVMVYITCTSGYIECASTAIRKICPMKKQCVSIFGVLRAIPKDVVKLFVVPFDGFDNVNIF